MATTIWIFSWFMKNYWQRWESGNLFFRKKSTFNFSSTFFYKLSPVLFFEALKHVNRFFCYATWKLLTIFNKQTLSIGKKSVFLYILEQEGIFWFAEFTQNGWRYSMKTMCLNNLYPGLLSFFFDIVNVR